jgi:tRNA-specific 2-thiouridylase
MTLNSKKIKVAVAMSGGVDSSVAAALMVEKHGTENVFGVTAKLFCYGKGTQNEKACCSLDAINDAKAVCDKLGIAHYVINEEEAFKKAVIENFIDAYKHGRTPIPCIPCNTVIKFGTMLEHVKKLGASKLVTGHYARVWRETTNLKEQISNYKLLRGVDQNKDQTYFLHGLNQGQLADIDFPIGEMEKPEVRKLAKKYDLKTAEKKESQGVCFVSEGSVIDWLADKIKRQPGDIVDTKGNVVGKHDGIVYYTVGQRKRIGGGFISPMFVVGIDATKNEVIIGGASDLNRRDLIVGEINWINEVKLPLKCTAKIRYNMEDTSCIVSVISTKAEKSRSFGLAQDDGYTVKFKKPQRAITPGQSIVFYQGDVCLGGGVIAS